MHLCTMCYLFDESVRVAIFVYWSAKKNANLAEDVEILIPVNFRQSRIISANERPVRPFCLSDQPEKQKLSRGCWDLASIYFSLNSIQWFQRRSRNVSANQRPGWPFYFSGRPEKHKLGRGRWDLDSCQVSFNSVQRFQRRSRKCLSQSEARAVILIFWSARKTQTW